MTIVVRRASSPSWQHGRRQISVGPTAVLEFYLGKIDESSLYAATEATDETLKTERQCQAHFYVAEAKLLKGAKDDAISGLQVAKSQCAPNTSFFHGANAELKRFGQ